MDREEAAELISFRLGAWLTVTWGFLAILTAFMNMSSAPAADDPSRQLVNAFSQPSIIKIDSPTIGDTDQEATLKTFFEIGNTAKNWLLFMVRAATLDHPFWQGNLVIVRYIFLLFSAPVMFIIAKAGTEILGGMLRGISRILPI